MRLPWAGRARQRFDHAIGGLAVAGIVTGVFISSSAEAGTVGRLSLAVLMLAVSDSIRQALKAPQMLREADYKLGYLDGRRDGRREARPVVVPLPLRGDDQPASVNQ